MRVLFGRNVCECVYAFQCVCAYVNVSACACVRELMRE